MKAQSLSTGEMGRRQAVADSRALAKKGRSLTRHANERRKRVVAQMGFTRTNSCEPENQLIQRSFRHKHYSNEPTGGVKPDRQKAPPNLLLSAVLQLHAAVKPTGETGPNPASKLLKKWQTSKTDCQTKGCHGGAVSATTVNPPNRVRSFLQEGRIGNVVRDRGLPWHLHKPSPKIKTNLRVSYGA